MKSVSSCENDQEIQNFPTLKILHLENWIYTKHGS